jgi:hypothetical protein
MVQIILIEVSCIFYNTLLLVYTREVHLHGSIYSRYCSCYLIWQLFPSARQLVGANPTPTPTPITATPDGTLTYFCTLVRANGSDYAYQALYSDNLKKQVTSEQFNKEWGFFNNPLSSCIGIIKSSSGTTATGTITTQNAQNQQNQMYSVTLIKKDGQWKIDNLQKQ